MACLLNTIEAAMKTLIDGMTTDGGYNFDWSGTNQEDEALCTFPHADIYLIEETNLDEIDSGAHSQAYYNRCDYEIVLKPNLSSVNTTPVFKIREEQNKAVEDLKMLFGNNITLNGSACEILYRGFTPENKRSGDVFRPGIVTTKWEVFYTQDRLDPEVIA